MKLIRDEIRAEDKRLRAKVCICICICMYKGRAGCVWAVGLADRPRQAGRWHERP